jgi:ABC-2 type transport system permease protein
MPTPAQERTARLASLPFERSVSSQRGFFAPFARSIREILGHRELVSLLVRRELRARYKNSSLGFLWSLIKPLTMLLIYYVAIGQFLGAARGIPQFAIFVYAGLTLWGLYSETVVAGTASIVGNAGLIKKVYLPREIFPLASTGAALFNFAIQFGVLLVASLLLGEFTISWNLLYIPVAIFIVLLYGVALAILFSALNVYLRDIEYLIDVGLLIFFWASPIVYSWSFVVGAAARTGLPWLEPVYLLNPMSAAIMAFQKGTWASGSRDTLMADGTVIPPQPWPADLDLRLAVFAVIGVLLLAIAQRVFGRLQGNFAQEI